MGGTPQEPTPSRGRSTWLFPGIGLLLLIAALALALFFHLRPCNCDDAVLLAIRQAGTLCLQDIDQKKLTDVGAETSGKVLPTAVNGKIEEAELTKYLNLALNGEQLLKERQDVRACLRERTMLLLRVRGVLKAPAPAKELSPLALPTPVIAQIDSERPTLDVIYETLSRIRSIQVFPYSNIEDRSALARVVACPGPAVIVAHLHAYRTKAVKDTESEDKLFALLMDIHKVSPATRFILYSSTFGSPELGGPGRADDRIVVESDDRIRDRLYNVADRVGAPSTANDYRTLVDSMQFAVWPLNANLRETNKTALQTTVGDALTRRLANNHLQPNGLCRQ